MLTVYSHFDSVISIRSTESGDRRLSRQFQQAEWRGERPSGDRHSIQNVPEDRRCSISRHGSEKWRATGALASRLATFHPVGRCRGLPASNI